MFYFPEKLLRFVPEVKDLILDSITVSVPYGSCVSYLYEFHDGTEVIDNGNRELWLQSKHHQNRIIRYMNFRFYTEVRDNETGGYEFIELDPVQKTVRRMEWEELRDVKIISANHYNLKTSEVDALLNEYLRKNYYQQISPIMAIIVPSQE